MLVCSIHRGGIDLYQYSTYFVRSCFLDVRFGLGKWDGIIGCPMNQDLSRAGGQEFYWRASIVPVRMFFWCSTNKSCYDTVSQLLLPRKTQIRYSCERDRAWYGLPKVAVER